MTTLLYCALSVFLFQCLLFAVALARKNNGIADIGWGLGFIIIAGITTYSYVVSYDVSNITQEVKPDGAFFLLVSLVALWGLRLTIYLLIRNWSKPEDWRYAKWREEWGSNFLIRSFLQVFVLQGFFMIVIGSPIVMSGLDSQLDTHTYTLLQYILIAVGLICWLIGFFFQAVGDCQLFVFKKDPANKGKVMRYGVWQYTRHPNYFGEATMWWGIFLISCVSAQGAIGVLLRMIGPSTITFMLLRVSGVTMLENKYKGNKEYEEYQRNTSAFIPMPIKKGASL
jgi:steroid 5-alpha reductase family enzyme